MAVSKEQRASIKKWDDVHMAYQTVKVYKTLLADFKKTCALRGDKVNTVMRLAMQDYVDSPDKPLWAYEKKGE